MSRRRKKQQKRAEIAWNPRCIAVAVAIGLVCQLGFVLAWQSALASHFARRAKQAIASEDFADAAEQARRALDFNPDAGYASYFAGQANRLLGHAELATENLQRALRTAGHRGQVLAELAGTEKQLGDTAAETAHLGEGLSIAPLLQGHRTSRARLGQLLFARGRWAEGTVEFRSIIGESRPSRFAFDGLAAGYEQLGAPDVAIAAAAVLLGSERFLPRARDHLLRLARLPSNQDLIVGILEAARGEVSSDDVKRRVIEELAREVRRL